MRTTIYLDENLDARVRRLVPGRGLSRFIAEAVAEKLSELESRELQDALREGYLAGVQERAEVEEDWQALDLEGWPG